DAAQQPIVYNADNPARIWLDLPATAIALPSRRVDVERGAVDTVTTAELNGRTRVVLNLDRSVPYDVRAQGNVIYVLVGASTGAGSVGAGSAAQSGATATRVAQ